ncbi:MAG TPA: hypothetical protein VKV15_24485 [Bryobacteraceae bacterium]|nr:hypothetical protein [Bryobacteraceae bacterium]
MARYITLGAGAIVVFGIVISVLLAIMPVPHRPIDYMVAGAVATLMSMFIVFLALIGTTMKAPGLFFKRRNK